MIKKFYVIISQTNYPISVCDSAESARAEIGRLAIDDIDKCNNSYSIVIVDGAA